MTRYAAFLRGINLGNRRVKMAELRAHLDGLDLEDVSTWLASGNVVFDRHPGGTDTVALEKEIEAHLEAALGFATDTFVRRFEDLERLLSLERVRAMRDEGFDVHAIFLRDEADAAVEERLDELESSDDRFEVLGREVLWFRRGRMSDSEIQPRHLEAALGTAENTMRNLNTVRRMVAKFGREEG